jgi:hypothetical protein
LILSANLVGSRLAIKDGASLLSWNGELLMKHEKVTKLRVFSPSVLFAGVALAAQQDRFTLKSTDGTPG